MSKEIPKDAFENALKGDPDAQYALYEWYFWNGQHRMHHEDAYRWLRLAAEGGHNMAQSMLRMQPAKFSEDTLESAENGDPAAQYALGEWYLFNGKNRFHHEEAYRLLTLAAESGLADAQTRLGIEYDWPPGNEDKAFYWLEKAAAQGHGVGCYFFAQHHLVDNENFHGKYCAKGVELLRRSATASIGRCTDAYLPLGCCLARGEGVKQDRVEAFAWFSVLKADDGYGWKDEMDKLIPQMTQEELLAGAALAAEYIEKYRFNYDQDVEE